VENIEEVPELDCVADGGLTEPIAPPPPTVTV
jgi:hypothetical protein